MKKGFTLVELLAVIVILAVILVIAIPQVLKAVDNSRKSAYVKNEQMVVNVAKIYLASNSGKAPVSEGYITRVGLNELQENNLIGEIKDVRDKQTTCTGYVLIINIGSNEYDYHPYLNCGENYVTENYVDTSLTSVEVLVVAGGGSGASTMSEHKGGGGGAGGLVFRSNYLLPFYNVGVTIGNGGEPIPDSEVTGDRLPGNNGEDSIFGVLVANGGGGGIRNNSYAIQNGAGGSGGGGHYSRIGGASTQGISPSGGYGNVGGSREDGEQNGYGGGGAGYPGKGSTLSLIANGTIYGGRWSGGDGLYEIVIGDTTYNFAQMFGTTYGEIINEQAWFAGGGGGGIAANGDATYGAGGRGGGGRGAFNMQGLGTVWGSGSSKGEDGKPNTGGGGGGARGGESGGGGSGIVLVRYPGYQKANGGIVTAFNGYTIHAFTEVGESTFEVLEF